MQKLLETFAIFGWVPLCSPSFDWVREGGLLRQP
jgi:hypothetical protein